MNVLNRVLTWIDNVVRLGQPGALLGDLPDLLLLSLVGQALPGHRVELLDGRSPLSSEQITRALEAAQEAGTLLLLRLTPQSGSTIWNVLPELLEEKRLPSGQELSSSFRMLVHSPLGRFPLAHTIPLQLSL